MIIHAVSIHTGGGKILLDHLITEKHLGEISHLICDERYEIPRHSHKHLTIHKITPTFWSRWKAESLLRNIASDNLSETVLCFSNLPPAFKIKNHVVLYLQNALLLPGIPLYVDSFKTKMRILYEKIWLNLFWSHIDEVWVQTTWMKDLLEKARSTPVKLNPITITLPAVTNREKKYDYITVSGSTPHKRLYELLKAWELMKNPPSLLVISDEPSKKIADQLTKNKNVTFLTNVNRENIFKHYEESKCLIVTSKIESYCLPIYEALHFGLKVLAPDEKYTNDIREKIEVIRNFSVDSLAEKAQGLIGRGGNS